MPSIADPMNALISLQHAVRNGLETHTGEIHHRLNVLLDAPNGEPRYTYAKIEDGCVKAMAIFALHEPIDGIPCFQVGYAVPETYRNRGWATEIVQQSIQEMLNGLGRNGVSQFYVEAIVGKENLASQAVAGKVLYAEGTDVIDSESGEPAVAFTKLFQNQC